VISSLYERVLTKTWIVVYSLLHSYAVWCSLLLLGYKPVYHVTVLNTVGSCNTMVSIVILYYNIMGPPSYIRYVIDRNVVMRRKPVLLRTTPQPYMLSRPHGGPTPSLGITDCCGKLYSSSIRHFCFSVAPSLTLILVEYQYYLKRFHGAKIPPVFNDPSSHR